MANIAGTNVKRPASGAPEAKRYSRRYDTDGPHMAARAGRTRLERETARQLVAAFHLEDRAGRSTAQQLAVLAKRPGQSRRERARLTAGGAS